MPVVVRLVGVFVIISLEGGKSHFYSFSYQSTCLNLRLLWQSPTITRLPARKREMTSWVTCSFQHRSKQDRCFLGLNFSMLNLILIFD